MIMSEREFWVAVRSALLLIVDAIERRYSLGKRAQKPVDSATEK